MQGPSPSNPIGYQIGSYFCICELGHGSYGDVYQGVSMTDPNLIVALKVISKKKIQKERSARVRAIRQKLLKSEVEIMLKLQSEHVVRCFDAYEDEENVIMALEYCNGGDLSQEIKKRGRIPEEEAIRILKHIIVGFSEMHKYNIIHRDLKSENIFKHNEKYKIGDFGFAKIITNLNDIGDWTTLGTLMTMAPEVMERRKYGIKADIWSLGVVFYEMICGHAPYSGLTAQSMNYTIKSTQLDLSGCSKQAGDLLRKMLVADPEQRISWTELYKEPILFKYSKSVILDEFQEDVELEESMKIHLKLENNEKENDMIEEMERHDNRAESVFHAPEIKRLVSAEVDEVRKQTKFLENANQLFKGYVDRLNFQRQKSILILEEIIQVLDDERVDLQKNRKECEFLYLLSSRCFFIVSPINDALKRRINIYKWDHYEEFLKSSWCASFIKDFKFHYQSVCRRHKQISEEVFKNEIKNLSRISDFFWKRTSRESYDIHQKFLCGIENVDFTPIDQIRYTTKDYLHDVKDRVEDTKAKTPFQQSVRSRLLYFLDSYYDIATADYQVDRNALVKIMQGWKGK